MTSNITPITAASNGADTNAEPERPRHGLPALRAREARELISLGMDALHEASNLGHDMHSVLYGDERRRQLPAAASPAHRGADLPGDRRALPVHARQRLRGTRQPQPAARGGPRLAQPGAGPGGRTPSSPASHSKPIPKPHSRKR